MLQEIELFPCNEASHMTLILLVEDDQSNADLFLNLLSHEASYQVFWTTNGQAAMHFTRQLKPRLFLLDYFLPDMNGIELYDQLHARKELEAVPALIISACLEMGGEDIKHRGLPAIEKPFELDDFLSTVQSTIAMSSVERGW